MGLRWSCGTGHETDKGDALDRRATPNAKGPADMTSVGPFSLSAVVHRDPRLSHE